MCQIPLNSRFATCMTYRYRSDLVVVRSVLFFGGFLSIEVYREDLAWLPDRQPWGNPVIYINPKFPLLTEVEYNFLAN